MTRQLLGVRSVVGCVAGFVVFLLCAYEALAGTFVAIGMHSGRDQDNIERRLKGSGTQVQAKVVRTSLHLGSHARGQTV